jgi:signal transduction histidine kinase
MTSTDIPASPPPQSAWQVLLRMRWLLGAAIALAFAVGQLVETVVVPARQLLLLDVVGWGLLGGLAVWLSLTWASRQERRYQTDLARALRAEQQLNTQLQRANSQLSLLSEVNRQIADSATLDEVLDAALAFPQRLTPASVTVLLLYDSSGAIVTRVVGAHTDELAHLRDQYDLADEPDQRHARQRTARHDPEGQRGACLVLPLHDGMTAVGRIELYLERARFIPEDELALLETIGSEIAEAIVSARRRAREERALYELERAIAEERARIARDIHDGIAQALAFRRMRIDLWLDWIESDRPRLREELIALKQLLREQIAELRRAIFALRPVQFDELGFVGGLHRYVVEFASQQGWDIHVDLSDIPAGLTPDIEAACFRVVQEALTNSAKHTQATQVDVTIDQVDQGLRVRVRDNGHGFEPGQQIAGVSEQMGLRQMRERLAVIGGQMTVLSQPGAGTEVRVWIPLNSSRWPVEPDQKPEHDTLCRS